MSAISGSSGTQGIFQYLQSLSASQSASQSTSTAGSKTSGDASNALQGLGGGHHHRGGGGHGGGELFSQIQSAVTSALQSAQSSGSGSDPNQVIQNAIAKVLKNQQNVTGGTAAQPGANAPTTDSDGTETSGTTAATSSDSATAKSAFAQLLQSNGVDPDQFHNDFLSAIQSVQNGGSVNPSSVFTGFPTGSAVDTLA